MTDVDHEAFALCIAAGNPNPTQQQLSDVALSLMRFTDAQRASIRFMQRKSLALAPALKWALDKLNDARQVCYGGVELEEIEERRQILETA